MNYKIILSVLGGAVLGAACAGLGFFAHYRHQLDFAEKNPQLIEVYDEVEENFYKDKDEELMEYSMISGMLAGLNDRYTTYTPGSFNAVERFSDRYGRQDKVYTSDQGQGGLTG